MFANWIERLNRNNTAFAPSPAVTDQTPPVDWREKYERAHRNHRRALLEIDRLRAELTKAKETA